ncbi:MAG TPA: metallophosphoesterase family protein [Chloroflexota bacterium]|nr:metallophosphoesterase family protein [Chloroflexota bacterium]
MRIGIVSDVHSNMPALAAVLDDMGQVDELWCLGDMVGYGPFPNECLDLLRSRNCLAVPGNHDWAAAGKIPLEDFNADARWACEWSRDQLNAEHVTFLSELPVTRTEGDFTLAHGTPHEPIWEYMTHGAVARLSFHYFASRFCLVGHTHVPLVFVDGGQQADTLHPGPKAPLQLGSTRAIINPGSVGQPRDGDPAAAYAILDTDEALIDFRRVSYDVPSIQARMRQLAFPERLIKRLAYGW